ncbi:sterol desaturase family protein [Pacificimonas flava]|uniref:Sterol desaturase n=1 Tax=Pacificimonas flava TaxID=1234595 RepID=M2T962_9SPHN|nr:sterol desaturase family protein [Pacificimonas flava]EMD83074.1 Sterol desaturase [Pacificimonas flava]MBB5280231.1 sterol desaturase/sphingolipid hydroxylase (fatty acid hydroxylase superfamily) [Pacificimonas flava]
MLQLAILILAMTLIVGARYLAVSGLFAAITARARPGLHGSARSRRQQRAERRWSLIAAFIYGAPTASAIWRFHAGGTAIYTDLSAYPLWWLPASILLYLFLHDTWFYWTHRAMHHRRLFPVMHRVHHNSRPPTAWAAMSFHWTESLSGALLIPALVFLIPIHIAALGLVLAVMTLFGTTNHLGWEIFPARFVNGLFGRAVITASHHHRHHQNYACNFGLYFRFWDRLCKTDDGLAGDFGREEREAFDRAAARRAASGSGARPVHTPAAAPE